MDQVNEEMRVQMAERRLAQILANESARKIILPPSEQILPPDWRKIFCEILVLSEDLDQCTDADVATILDYARFFDAQMVKITRARNKCRPSDIRFLRRCPTSWPQSLGQYRAFNTVSLVLTPVEKPESIK